jgi:NADH-quinone oxidoreductase subunit N
MDNVVKSIADAHGVSFIVALAILIPEILVACSAVILLLGGVFAGSKSAYRMHGMATILLIALLGLMIVPNLVHHKQILFSHMLVLDAFSFYVKVSLVVATILALLLSMEWIQQAENQQFEYPVLILLSLLGMMLLVSSNDLTAFYIAIELMSLPLYVLASFSRDTLKSTEAGLKYFVLGALASGMLLFGASLVYGFAGTTSFEALGKLFHESHHADNGVLIGLILIMVGVCFKISAAPFHMWAPDVYEGAPTPITAFFTTAPKVAALSLFARLLMQPFGGLMIDWQQVIIVVSVASMLVGAFGALAQSNIKRLLAYSSIGHVGYALMGIAAGGVDGISSVLIYLALYIAMSAGAFACVLLMKREGKPIEEIQYLAGLSRTRPGIAFALAVFMFSMAGIPPLSGFFGKMYVFLSAIHAGLTILAIIGVLTSVVACFYYLKIVKLMYFDEPAATFDMDMPYGIRIVLIFSTLVTFLFFLVPIPLVEQARIAAEALFQ